MCVYIYIYIYIQCVCVCVYIYIYIYIYIYQSLSCTDVSLQCLSKSICKLVEKVRKWLHLTTFVIRKDKRTEKEEEEKRYIKNISTDCKMRQKAMTKYEDSKSQEVNTKKVKQGI